MVLATFRKFRILIFFRIQNIETNLEIVSPQQKRSRLSRSPVEAPKSPRMPHKSPQRSQNRSQLIHSLLDRVPTLVYLCVCVAIPSLSVVCTSLSVALYRLIIFAVSLLVCSSRLTHGLYESDYESHENYEVCGWNEIKDQSDR